MPSGTENKDLGTTDLKNILDTMSYNESANQQKLAEVLKKFDRFEDAIYWSIWDGKPYVKGYMDHNFEICGVKINGKYLDLAEAGPLLHQALEKQILIPLSEIGRAKRLAKLHELVKQSQADLVALEAYACRVAPWTVEECDASQWFPSMEDESIKDLYWTLEKESGVMVLDLKKESYSLANVIACLTGAVLAGKPVAFIVRDDPNRRHILPLLYMVTLINRAGICDHPITVLNMLLQDDADPPYTLDPFSLLVKSAKTPRKRVLLSNFPVNEEGNGVHIIVEDSVDIAVAAQSIFSKIWTCGAQINHRCRPLLFVHSSMEYYLLESLRSCVLELKIKEGGFLTSSMSGTEFPFNYKQRDILHAVYKIGAPIMGCKDLKGPAAIYDIGTCADIVAIKGPGLGHILIIIPYRNITELVQLANNFGHPEQVFIYGDAFSDTVRIAQSLNGTQLVVNDAKINPGAIQRNLSWYNAGNYLGEPDNQQPDAAAESSADWASFETLENLSNAGKIEKMHELWGHPTFIKILARSLAYQLEIQAGCTMGLPRTDTDTTLILRSTEKMSISRLLTVLTPILARNGRVNVVLVGEVESPARRCIERLSGFPAKGTALFSVHLATATSLAELSFVSDLVWIISDLQFPPESTPKFPTSATLLTNHVSDKDTTFDLHAKKALSSAVKLCFF